MDDFEEELEKRKEKLLNIVSDVLSNNILITRKSIKIFDSNKFVFWINLKDAIYFVLRTSRDILYELIDQDTAGEYTCVTPLEVRFVKKRISVDVCYNGSLQATEVYIYENSESIAHFYPENEHSNAMIHS